MSHTKPQRAGLRLPAAAPKPRSSSWWQFFTSALPPFTSPRSLIPWCKLAAWWLPARHRTLSLSPSRPRCGCRPLMCAWILSSTCSCAGCSGKDSRPHCAARPSRSLPPSLGWKRALTWRWCRWSKATDVALDHTRRWHTRVSLQISRTRGRTPDLSCEFVFYLHAMTFWGRSQNTPAWTITLHWSPSNLIISFPMLCRLSFQTFLSISFQCKWRWVCRKRIFHVNTSQLMYIWI